MLNVGRARVAGGVRPVIIFHDENGHMSCWDRPAPKLTNNATKRKTWMERRLSHLPGNRRPASTSNPDPTNAAKPSALAMFVFTVCLPVVRCAHPQAGSTRRGKTDSSQRTLALPFPRRDGNRPE